MAPPRPAAVAARGALVACTLASFALNAVPLTAAELTKLCADAEGPAHCARLVEGVQLRRLPNLAIRDGPALKVSLDPSGATTYADTEALNGGRTYSFWDYMSEINSVLVYVTDGDDASFLLLQRATGRSSELPSDPRLSPDRLHLVTADFCDARCGNEVAVWRVTRDGARKELFWKPREAWSDAVATWLGATGIAIEYTAAGTQSRSRLERRLGAIDWVPAPTR